MPLASLLLVLLAQIFPCLRPPEEKKQPAACPYKPRVRIQPKPVVIKPRPVVSKPTEPLVRTPPAPPLHTAVSKESSIPKTSELDKKEE
ncbi:hypothetical protein ADUPG1_000534 [Aduncisulcus paluster]|uniref:Uncharacterized protein n=1 Tax=Aduncisulcus paluster TaxID=2918883 RepID=A0ABQ5K6P9_9EUKA|nr:hypothetical protein ADUPG1_000534 [Aduncisulcus paluster]